MNVLRGQIGGAEKFDARLVREEDWPELETRSYLARDFVGVVHTALKQAMKNAENPETADLRDTFPTRLWRDERDGSRVATFLDLKD